MKRALPLHVSIPLSLAVLAFLVTLIGAVQMRATSYRQLETTISARALALSRMMVPILSRPGLDGDRASVDEAILDMSSMPFLAPVLVLDEDGQVLFASDPALRARRLADTYAHEAQPLIARARASGATQAEIDPEGQSVRVAQPYPRLNGAGRAVPGRTAVLFTQTDLSFRKHQELMAIMQGALLSGLGALIACLLVWLYLRATFTQPLRHMVGKLAGYTPDKTDWHISEDGAPELAQIGRVVNRMFADLSAERAMLRANADKFARVFAGAPVLFSLSDVETGRFTEVNEEAIRVSGYSREELVGKTSVEIGWIGAADRQRLLAVLRDRGRVDGMELRLRTKSGREVECLYYGDVISLDGKPQLVSVSQDVSEMRRAERALRDSEERLRALFDGAADAVFIHTPDGRLVDVNQAACTSVGYSREELLTMSVRDIETGLGPADLDQLWRGILTGRSATLEGMQRRRDGSTFPVEVHVARFGTGEQPLLFAAARDITLRKQMEDALRERNEYIETVLQNAPIGFSVHSIDDGVARFVNRRFEEIYGVPRGAFTTVERWYELVFPDPDVRERMRQRFRADMATGDPAKMRWEDIPIGAGPEPRYVTIVNIPLPEQRLLVTTVQDVTHRVLTEASLLQSERQLLHAQKMEAIGQLAGGVAHDFNNTLTTTLMTLELLLDNANLDPETYDGLKALEAQAKRAASLTRQLLLFSRRSVLEMRVLDLNEIVSNLLKMLGRLLGEHIVLAFERCPVASRVEVDSGMIEQVLINLCVNARDAMPRGGRITIAIEVVEASAPEVIEHAEGAGGRYICMSVTDSGQGMSEETQRKIFEPFFTTKEPGKGTGLGLATVHGIVTQHKGWVDVHSTLGQGSSFKVLLPEATQAMSVPTCPGPSGKAGGHETILLVEDEPGIREVTALGLRRLGYVVLEAANGNEALELWTKHRALIDLLLSDMMMPGGLTGHDLALRLREANPGLKVIICSGYIPETSVGTSQVLADVVHVQKPYHVRELSQIIRQCLDLG